MTNVYVRFANSNEATIVAVFGCPQDPEVYPNQGTIEDDDPRYLQFLNPQPTPEQILAAKQAQKSQLLNSASLAMTPIYMALQLGDAAGAVTVSAKAWRAYYVALEAVDITVDIPVWPAPPV